MVARQSGARDRTVRAHGARRSVLCHADSGRRRARSRQYPGAGGHGGGHTAAAGGGAADHLSRRVGRERPARRGGGSQHLAAGHFARHDRVSRGHRHPPRPPARGRAAARRQGRHGPGRRRSAARHALHGARGDPPVRGQGRQEEPDGPAEHPRVGHRAGDAHRAGRHRHQFARRLCQELRGAGRPRSDVVARHLARRGARGAQSQQRQHRRRLHRQERRAAVHSRRIIAAVDR